MRKNVRYERPTFNIDVNEIKYNLIVLQSKVENFVLKKSFMSVDVVKTSRKLMEKNK